MKFIEGFIVFLTGLAFMLPVIFMGLAIWGVVYNIWWLDEGPDWFAVSAYFGGLLVAAKVAWMAYK